MALLEYVDPAQAGPEVNEILDADAERYGKPSLFSLILANHPAMLAARHEYADRVLSGGRIDEALKELAYVAVSAANDCSYCVASHTEHLVESVGLPEDRVAAILDGDLDGFDDRERVVIEFARAVATDSKRIGDDDIDRLREQGFDDADVVELVVAISAASVANTITDALNVLPQDRDADFAAYAESARD